MNQCVLTIFILLISTQCSFVKVIYKDNTFDYTDLKNSKILLIGVTSLHNKNYKDISQQNRVMENIFTTHRRDLFFIPHQQFIINNNLNKYLKILKNIKTHQKSIARLQKIYPNLKYLIIAEISSDYIHRYHFPDDPIGVINPERRDLDMITAIVYRKMEVLLSIYRINNMKLVWLAKGNHEMDSYIEYTPTGDWDGGVFIYKSLDEYPFPPAPDENTMLKTIFLRLSKAIPHK